MSPAASVIVRTKNSAKSLPATLKSARAQSVDVELVIVDSGSTDSTLDIAARHGARIVCMPAEEFTYGGALNLGAANATCEVHIALSSHCELPREDWVTRAVAHIERGAAGAVGAPVDPAGRPLLHPIDANHAMLRDNRMWGFSNHASAWFAPTWRQHHFREDLPAAEDKEWSWRATGTGGWITVDPLLVVSNHHRRSAGVRSYHDRLVKEWTALEPDLKLPGYSLVEAALDWTRQEPREARLSSAPRFGRTRLVEVIARRNAGRARRGR